MMRSLCTPQRKQNVLVGWGWKVSLMDIQWSGSFTEAGTVAGKAIFEVGFKFSASESRKNFDSTASADRRANWDKSGSERSNNFWQFMINNNYSKKWTRSIYYLKLHPNVMKLGRKMDQNVSEYIPISADPVPVSADQFSQHLWVFDEIEVARDIPSATNNFYGYFDFINDPQMMRKWISLYRYLFRDIFVCIALLSTSDFRSYVCRIGTLWFCYIT